MLQALLHSLLLPGRNEGCKGKPKGTIATSPKEVDAIARTSYGKIYKGYCEDQEKMAKKYVDKNCIVSGGKRQSC